MSIELRKPAAVVCGLLMFAVTPCVSLASNGSQLLDAAKVGMRASHRNIKSFSGSVQQTSVLVLADGGQLISERIVTGCFDGHKGRVSCRAISGNAFDFESEFDGAKTTDWIKNGIVEKQCARISSGKKGFGGSALESILDPRGHGISSKDHEATDIAYVCTELFNGDECIVAQVGPVETRPGVEVVNKTWICPAKGFAIPKHEACVISKDTGKVLRRQEHVTVLKQYDDDVWGPATNTIAQYGEDGKLVWSNIQTYDPDFKINCAIKDEDLKLKLPSGLPVDDFVQDLEYDVP